MLKKKNKDAQVEKNFKKRKKKENQGPKRILELGF